MEVTFLFFKRDLNIPLFTLTFHLHLILPHERFSAVAANNQLRLLGLESFGAVEVAAEGDEDGVRGRRLEGERQV